MGYDAIVLGGGPAGSTAAAFLAMGDRRVLLLEKETFPRFHIGESLLPYNAFIFEELGLTERLQNAGFPIKTGAQFHIGNGSKALHIVFGRGKFNRSSRAFQVERSVFDELLLRNAEEKGAEVLECWEVKQSFNGSEGVSVTAVGPGGESRVFEANYLVDATGRSNVTGNRDGLRVPNPDLKKFSVYGHYSGVQLDEGDRGGDTVIVRQKNGWFWLIPIGMDRVSVGWVMDHAEFSSMKLNPQVMLEHQIKECPVMNQRMAEANRLTEIRSTSDFSYHNRALTGPRLLRVGDAAGFVDPIFSSGVYLAMRSGRLAARSILEVIMNQRRESNVFKTYEKETFATIAFYRRMVEGFYTHPFMEVLMEPRDFLSLTDAVNGALAGELHWRWAIRWRIRLFFWIVKLQSIRPILPRFRYENK